MILFYSLLFLKSNNLNIAGRGND